METRIIITNVDFQRLNAFVRTLRHAWTYGAYVNDLERTLRLADIVPAEQVPEEVVTMDSAVLARNRKSECWELLTLVYTPSQEPGSVSVLSSLGTALLGRREGDLARASDREQRVVEKILYQPEAAGHHHL